MRSWSFCVGPFGKYGVGAVCVVVREGYVYYMACALVWSLRSINVRGARRLADYRRGYPCPGIDDEINVGRLSKGNFLTGQLCVPCTTVKLRNCDDRVVPHLRRCKLVDDLIRRTIIRPPWRAVNGRDHATNFEAKDVLEIRRATYPMTFQLLTNDRKFNRHLRTICMLLTMLIYFKRIFRCLYRDDRRPAITACPRIFLAVRAFIF